MQAVFPPGPGLAFSSLPSVCVSMLSVHIPQGKSLTREVRSDSDSSFVVDRSSDAEWLFL